MGVLHLDKKQDTQISRSEVFISRPCASKEILVIRMRSSFLLFLLYVLMLYVKTHNHYLPDDREKRRTRIHLSRSVWAQMGETSCVLFVSYFHATNHIYSVALAYITNGVQCPLPLISINL
ncbi:hypothetical protein BKA67DRAFT_550738 [Truncatella angustata]|uniref:Uncharacterized protein n=1 Tax=Truncatella angustata TaxID=152316 RepID=A0A9P8V0L1_9PEZI|nr:uncharacterized protein BKA67DRAFT_550738 [Truncatella angustata]KAH6661289.1 hypothetical protein BKA67DRAFT_550738 [Truncatella angustata]